MAPRSAAAAPAPNAAQQNLMARQMVLANALEMEQQIFSNTYSSNIKGQVINVQPRNVGLIKSFIVEISGTIGNAAAETLTRTPFGAANILSNVQFTDLANNVRINTTGWHLHAMATARRQFAYGAAATTDSQVSIGSNFPVMDVPSSVTTDDTFRMFYEIPVSYSDFDLRGAIWAGVVNATMNLQLTVNPNFVVASTANGAQAVYKSSSADLGDLSSLTVTVYQKYLDQIPTTNNGYVLPFLDLSTAYQLNNTAFTGLAVNQDNTIPYSNFREFMSTFVIYDNYGSSSTPGTDITRLKLQSANFTNILDVDPYYASLRTRNIINDDFPATAGLSSYYFDFRKKPLMTTQYGNLELIVNPSQVQSSTSQLLVGFETLSIINQVVGAGSLPANN